MEKDINKLKFLIVEDDFSSRELLIRLLSKKGVFFKVATNGQEALELVKDQQFDFILLDIKMPILNGFETIKEIKKLSGNPKILAQTAHAFPEDKANIKDAGFDGYISKPYSKDALFEAINKVLNN